MNYVYIKNNEEYNLLNNTNEIVSDEILQKRHTRGISTCTKDATIPNSVLTPVKISKQNALDEINHLNKFAIEILYLSDKFMINLLNLIDDGHPDKNPDAIFLIIDPDRCTSLNGPYFFFRAELMTLIEYVYKLTAPQGTYEMKMTRTLKSIATYVKETMLVFNNDVKTIEILVGLKKYHFCDIKCILKRELRDYFLSLKKIIVKLNTENKELHNMKKEILSVLNSNARLLEHNIYSLLTNKYLGKANKSRLIDSDDCYKLSQKHLDYNIDFFQDTFYGNKQIDSITQIGKTLYDKQNETHQENSKSVENKEFNGLALGFSMFFGLLTLVIIIVFGIRFYRKRNNDKRHVFYSVNYNITEVDV